AAFDRQVLSGIDVTVSRVEADSDFLDEVRQRLRERLLVGADARIREYRGVGPLPAWTRVAAMRTALNSRREMQRRRERQRNAELRAQPSPERDPELNLIYAHYSARVENAFRAAFALLPSPHRELLRLHYVEGLTHELIAQNLGIERSILSRRIGAARR